MDRLVRHRRVRAAADDPARVLRERPAAEAAHLRRDGRPSRLRESHTAAYRDPAGLRERAPNPRPVLPRQPEVRRACQLASHDCTQRWAYDGGDRLIEENDGHGDRRRYLACAPAGGVDREARRRNRRAEVLGDIHGTRMTTFSRPGATSRMHYDTTATRLHADAGGRPATTAIGGDDPSPNLVADYAYDYRNRLTAWRPG